MFSLVELVRRYPFVWTGAGVFFNLGFVLPFAIFNIWDKFSDDKVPAWLARRGWTMNGAVGTWLGVAFILTLVIILVLYLIFRYCLPPLLDPSKPDYIKKRDWLVERLTDFIKEERKLNRGEVFYKINFHFGIGAKIEHFLGLHLPEHVEHFQQKGIDALEDIIHELLESNVALVQPKVPPPDRRERGTASSPKPNLVLMRTRLAYTTVHNDGVAAVKLVNSTMDELNTALVEFGNEIGAKGLSVRITDLRARISFYDEAGKFYHRVNKGWWVFERFPSINLDAGETAELILLHRINGDFGSHKVKRYHIEDNPNTEQGVSDYSSSKVIDGRKFRVEVVLIYGSPGEVIGTHNIELTLEPAFEVKVVRDT